jgi:hypothetical protein
LRELKGFAMGALDYREYYTKADFVKWGGDWELIDGMAYAMAPSPLVTHQNIVVKIAAQLNNAVSECESCLVGDR